MLITGILITIVAFFMILVPQFFMGLKSPRIPDKILKWKLFLEYGAAFL